MLFNNLDNPNNKDKKLSILERLVIKGLVSIVILTAKRIGKTTTYGELQKYVDHIDVMMDAVEEKFGEVDENNAQEFASLLDEKEKEIKSI